MLIIFSGCEESGKKPAEISKQPPTRSRSGIPGRLIATTPSIAEILYELGVGDRLVGVCKFCKYPEEVKNVPKIGGLIDRDYEAILRSNPDLVIELEENVESCEQLRKYGLEVLTVEHKTIDGMLDSIPRIGKRFGPETEKKAAALREKLVRAMQEIETKTRRVKPVRVLIAVDRERGSGQLLSLYVAGRNPFFEKVLQIAGGTNVAGDAVGAFPVVSQEGILRMNPEVIVDLCATDENNSGREGIDDWNSLGNSIDAVRNKRVYLIQGDYATIPGPRTIRFIRELAEILHGNL